MRVMFLGLRGFPGVQGGVETHVQHLAPRLVELGCEVEAIVRSPYMPPDASEWRGVRFRRVWAPKSKALEAIVHSILGVLIAAWRRPDILHIHAVGPALVTPLATLLGLRVVVTHHGPDYDRQKWGRLAKGVLRFGECVGMRMSHGRVVISDVIRRIVKEKYGVESTLIPNGVAVPEPWCGFGLLDSFGLVAERYVVFVGRLVPEKRHLDLIEAFRRAQLNEWKLAIVGASDHPDAYAQCVLEAAAATPGVVCVGFQSGINLAELFGSAGLFVLPSAHEGLPIALLEALSYGLPAVASNIPANVEVGLPAEHYFPLGDVDALVDRLRTFAFRPLTAEVREARRQWVLERFDWQRIARKTLELYQSVVSVGSVPRTGPAEMKARIDLQQFKPEAMAAMMGLQNCINGTALEKRLIELVKLRASQLSGCAHCIDMHSKDARAGGEAEQRVYALDAWRETELYTPRERAALAWTEAVTRETEGHVPDAVFAEAREHFEPAELADLTIALIAINGWNRLCVALRVVPDSYRAVRPHTQVVACT